ncbi:NmrA-like family domain-containing protein 1 [Seminavis robusta]|uniref:NmrA-like family domain-containing protein 1 n=1 Tax=Seminavis robusta TaxID=568900 RepID=A0A9N8DBL3_9STRA|nr:NmrA-like family domain-containing protein 1 [Seminavis robusta]|eukprot:Sro73_g040560.1 NmrA-like family domain-containing protein 1 (307) ;mRNA; r:129316-130236
MILNAKTIAVLGALGGQGGSVVNTFLEDGSFKVRGVTRSVNSPASKELQGRGVEMVPGNVKEPASLSQAFTGADIAFVVVNFWDPDIGTKEGKLTNEIFHEAKKAGVKHVIFSSLANVGKVSGGEITVPHFTLKAEAWEYLQTMGFDAVTAVEPAAYYSNWFSFFKPVEDDKGTLVWTWPGKEGNAFSQFDVNTGVGPSVLAAAKDPSKYNNSNILLEGEKISVEDVVSQISEKLGKPGRVHFEDPKKFATFFDGAHELAQMVKWFEDYGYYGPETETRKHGIGKEIGGLVSFQEWLDKDEYKKLL